MKYILLFILLVSSSSIAQYSEISGTVTDRDSGKPLEDVDVFIDNSNSSTVTNSNGFFKISIKGNNNQPLVFSKFGYSFFTIPAKNIQQHNEVSLIPESEIMEEMIIEKTSFSRKQMMDAFKYFFLGNSSNAKKTSILNEDDIQLYYNSSSNSLIAIAEKPVRLINKNLGYELSFYLETFAVQFREKTLETSRYDSSIYLGYTLYTKTTDSKKIHKERLKVYENNPSSFFRELSRKNLSNDSYMLTHEKMTVPAEDYFTIDANENDYVVYLKQKPIKKTPIYDKGAFSNGVFNPNSIKEFKTEEVPLGIMNMKTQQQSLLFFRKRYLRIDRQGNLEEPDAVFYGGYFSELKVGDMLPVDFIIEEQGTPTKYNEKDILKDNSFLSLVNQSHLFYTSKAYVSYSRFKTEFNQYTEEKIEDFNSESQLTEWMEKNSIWKNRTNAAELKTIYHNYTELKEELSIQKNELEKKETTLRRKYGENLFDPLYKDLVIKKILSTKTN